MQLHQFEASLQPGQCGTPAPRRRGALFLQADGGRRGSMLPGTDTSNGRRGTIFAGAGSAAALMVPERRGSVMPLPESLAARRGSGLLGINAPTAPHCGSFAQSRSTRGPHRGSGLDVSDPHPQGGSPGTEAVQHRGSVLSGRDAVHRQRETLAVQHFGSAEAGTEALGACAAPRSTTLPRNRAVELPQGTGGWASGAAQRTQGGRGKRATFGGTEDAEPKGSGRTSQAKTWEAPVEAGMIREERTSACGTLQAAFRPARLPIPANLADPPVRMGSLVDTWVYGPPSPTTPAVRGSRKSALCPPHGATWDAVRGPSVLHSVSTLAAPLHPACPAALPSGQVLGHFAVHNDMDPHDQNLASGQGLRTRFVSGTPLEGRRESVWQRSGDPAGTGSPEIGREKDNSIGNSSMSLGSRTFLSNGSFRSAIEAGLASRLTGKPIPKALKSCAVVSALKNERREYAAKLDAYADALRVYLVQKPLEEAQLVILRDIKQKERKLRLQPPVWPRFRVLRTREELCQMLQDCLDIMEAEEDATAALDREVAAWARDSVVSHLQTAGTSRR
eukprot:jgi/Botrbrau1/21674/Bobra.43_1s0071.1